MAISLIDNLKIQNKKQNVERDSFVTIADMVAYSPNYLPNLFHTMCEETGKMYVYNVNNDIDPVLGKWRELGSGGGTPTPTPENYYTKAQTEDLISENVQTLTDDEISNILNEIF